MMAMVAVYCAWDSAPIGFVDSEVKTNEVRGCALCHGSTRVIVDTWWETVKTEREDPPPGRRRP